MNLMLKLFIPVSLLTYLSVLYIDRPVALFINDSLYKNRHWSGLTSSLPDLLLILVIIISAASCSGYFYRKKKSLLDLNTRFLGFIALTLPIAYILKTILKLLFGRIETRIWLKTQRLYEFHLMHGGANFNGFPSGHMLVFTTLFVAISRYHPEYRVYCYSLLGILAILLAATNYHFVGDILFGAYLGFLIEGVMDRFFRGMPVHGGNVRTHGPNG